MTHYTSASGSNVTVANLAWTPFGGVSTFSSPCVGTGCTTPLETYHYNKRLQADMIELGTATTPAAKYCLVYIYYSGNAVPTSCSAPSSFAGGNNGNVFANRYQDSVNTSLGHTTTHTYDSLNRLGGAVAKT